MKKYFAILVAVIFVFGVAGAGLAQQAAPSKTPIAEGQAKPDTTPVKKTEKSEDTGEEFRKAYGLPDYLEVDRRKLNNCVGLWH